MTAPDPIATVPKNARDRVHIDLADSDFDKWPWSRRCPIVDAELRAMWWRLRRQGVDISPERGLSLIGGGTT